MWRYLLVKIEAEIPSIPNPGNIPIELFSPIVDL